MTNYMKIYKRIKEYLEAAYEKWDDYDVVQAFCSIYYNEKAPKELKEIVKYGKKIYDMTDIYELAEYALQNVGHKYMLIPHDYNTNGTPNYITEDGNIGKGSSVITEKELKKKIRDFEKSEKKMVEIYGKRGEIRITSYKLIESDPWKEEDCKKLCELAGINWEDYPSLEEVTVAAADKLDINIGQ